MNIKKRSFNKVTFSTKSPNWIRNTDVWFFNFETQWHIDLKIFCTYKFIVSLPDKKSTILSNTRKNSYDFFSDLENTKFTKLGIFEFLNKMKYDLKFGTSSGESAVFGILSFHFLDE